MRDHIYRAWDEETKTMYYDDELEEALSEKNFVATLSYGKLVIGAYDKHDDWRELKSMQKTGVRVDKEEIWEGDIASITVRGEEIRCVVVYDSNQAKFKACPISLYKANAGNGGWTGWELSYVRIILGNIFQNPEFLEE